MRSLFALVGVCIVFARLSVPGAALQVQPQTDGVRLTNSSRFQEGYIQFSQICASPTPTGEMVIRWVTNVPTTSKVQYGTTASYGKETLEDPRLVERHKVVLSGLEENRLYHFRVCGSTGLGYPRLCSSDCTFFTLPPPSPALINGGFDEHGMDSTRKLYPWVLYTTGDETIGYNPIDGIVGPCSTSCTAWFGGIKAFDGLYFLGAAANWGCKNGGVFQRVLWPPGERCVFSVRYVAFNRGGIPWDTKVRVGIDPEGGIDPNSPSIKWWTGFPQTNDARWLLASVSAVAGNRGVITVFIDVRQRWELEWHVVAVDHATLTSPMPISIGELKSSLGDFGVVLEDKLVTFVSAEPIIVSLDGSYYKAYVLEPNRTAGIAVLFNAASAQIPQTGDKVTVIGSVVNHNLEAHVAAVDWVISASDAPLPGPLAISTKDVGGVDTAVQPSLFQSSGLSNVGMRVRVFGQVVWVDSSLPWWNATAIIDDGAGIVNQLPARATIPKGLRIKLPGSSYGVQVGDYVIATGVLSVEFVDPKPPPYSGDEYFAYTVLVASPDDWQPVPR